MKKFLLFLSLMGLLFGSATPPVSPDILTSPTASPDSPQKTAQKTNPQKLADKPRDMPISVLLQDGSIACYAPDTSNSTIKLTPCANAPKARYDVFSRVAWQVNDIWLCMSVESGKTTESRLLLRPCTINDERQRFIVRNNAFLHFPTELQIKDKNGSLIALKPNDTSARNHALSGMQAWLSTIATPAGISTSTFIAWTFFTPESFDMYYLTNDRSIKNDLQELIYNPETKQIGLFDPQGARLVCMTSQQTKSQEWNWLIWQKCQNLSPNQASASSHLHPQQWEIYLFGENSEALLRDYLGNFLRVTKYGAHWGVPYTATKTFIVRDRGNSPTSFFRFSHDSQDWQRFVSANIADELQTCPASGDPQQLQDLGAKKADIFASLAPEILIANPTAPSSVSLLNPESTPPKASNLTPPLPEDFVLSEAWKRRLFVLATSTDGVPQRAGDCGVCLLQTYQMLAELITSPYAPLSEGGYFFDAQQGVNPFPSFRLRYPLLANQLDGYSTANDTTSQSWQDTFIYATQVYRAIALSMLPGYFWVLENFYQSQEQILRGLDAMLQSPIGSAWVLHFHFTDAQGRQRGHGMPVMRLRDGLLFVPTNVTGRASFEGFERLLNISLVRSAQDAYNIISLRGTRRMIMVAPLQMRRPYENPLTSFVSVHNCDGDGEGRRGSRDLPLSQMINQCASGRCLIQ